MGLETATYIGDLNTANPTGTDPKSQGDDHIRLLKSAARNSFPGFPGVVVGTGAESGSGDAFVVTLSPAPASYAAGMMVVFKATHANTGAATLQVNALAAKALKAVDGSALESGDIESGAIVGAFCDGADFFLISGVDRAARGGDSYSGTHDFTGATVQLATLGGSEDSTKAASTGWVRGLFGKIADQLWSGIQDFTGATTKVATAAPGTNDTTAASTAFATQLSFQAALPAQAGQGGKLLGTNGTSASWEASANQAAAEAGTAIGPWMSPLATAQAIRKLARTVPDVIIELQKPQGTAGVIAPSQIELNTFVRNVASLALNSAGNVTLPAGTYLIRGAFSATGRPNGGSIRAQLRNNTAGTNIAIGKSTRLMEGQGALIDVSTVVTLESSSVIQLLSSSTTNWNNGEPINSGIEVYATFEATQLG